MASPTRMRAMLKDGVTEVRVMMQHEMENGRRKDEAGNIVPAWHITEFTAQHNSQTVLEGQFGPSVSKNPYLVFRIKGGKSGDRITLSWADNRGDKRSDEVTID